MAVDELLTHPGKVFWPEEGYTKLDLAQFYEAVFGRLQPYVQDRMLSLERCPDGMLGECFFQKQAPKNMPSGTPTKLIRHPDHPVRYVVGGSLETQIALVNLGCIPVHVWSSSAAHPQQPDWVVFDIDPGSGAFSDAAKAGLLVKEALDSLGLASFPKTSGGRGMHVFVPIEPGPGFDDTRTFAEETGQRLAASHPSLLTVEQRLEAREGRVYLDPFRNSFGATVVAPYSVRRQKKAPFSMPLRWQDVSAKLDPTRFNLGSYKSALRGRDPWRRFFERRQPLGPAASQLHKI